MKTYFDRLRMIKYYTTEHRYETGIEDFKRELKFVSPEIPRKIETIKDTNFQEEVYKELFFRFKKILDNDIRDIGDVRDLMEWLTTGKLIDIIDRLRDEK